MGRALRSHGAAFVCVAALAVAGCYGGTEEEKTQETKAAEAVAASKPAGSANPVIEVKTSKGTIAIELFPDKAPKTVENFLTYVNDGYYSGTLFHRVIPDFMIQGGGYTATKERKETRAPVANEANNGLKNETGTLAMARTSDPNSATSQFFINVKDNAFLDFKSETPQGWGYTVFGKVIEGTEVVHAIEQTPTSDQGGAFANMPLEPVVIESISVRKSS